MSTFPNWTKLSICFRISDVRFNIINFTCEISSVSGAFIKDDMVVYLVKSQCSQLPDALGLYWLTFLNFQFEFETIGPMITLIARKVKSRVSYWLIVESENENQDWNGSKIHFLWGQIWNQLWTWPLDRQIYSRLLYFSSASIFKVLQCRSKLVQMLSECQKAWIRLRRRATLRLIRIQAVCIWD